MIVHSATGRHKASPRVSWHNLREGSLRISRSRGTRQTMEEAGEGPILRGKGDAKRATSPTRVLQKDLNDF